MNQLVGYCIRCHFKLASYIRCLKIEKKTVKNLKNQKKYRIMTVGFGKTHECSRHDQVGARKNVLKKLRKDMCKGFEVLKSWDLLFYGELGFYN